MMYPLDNDGSSDMKDPTSSSVPSFFQIRKVFFFVDKDFLGDLDATAFLGVLSGDLDGEATFLFGRDFFFA